MALFPLFLKDMEEKVPVSSKPSPNHIHCHTASRLIFNAMFYSLIKLYLGAFPEA